MWSHVVLEPEQEALFSRLVEASRSVPRNERETFLYAPMMQASLVQGNGLSEDVLDEDILALQSAGLIQVAQYASSGSGFSFVIPPGALQYYEEVKRRSGEPLQQLEADTRAFLDAGTFREEFPAAYAKWKEAAELLWHTDSDAELSTIGHKCREAIQEFASTLIERYHVEGATPDPSKTRERISAVIEARREALGERKAELLDAVFNYWKAAGNLIQRQEHAGQREGEALGWEDGRRVVFQTAIVMFEIERALSVA